MWEAHLKRPSNGHFSNLLAGHRSSSLTVAAPTLFAPVQAPAAIRACTSPSGSWSRNVWSGILAASLLISPWTSGRSQAVVLESRQAISYALPQHASKHPQFSLFRQSAAIGKPVAVPMAQPACTEAASDTRGPVRSEGYLMAKGHNGQINRVYYSVPKGQAATQNALYFVGDYVDGDGDALIERLNTGEGIAATLLPKLDVASNLFIVYPSAYRDRIWACYTSMLPATSLTGEPLGFEGKDPVAARQLGALLQDALRQISASPEGTRGVNGEAAANGAAGRSGAGQPVGHAEASVPSVSTPSFSPLPTFVTAFSKGGVVLNELLAEMAALEDRGTAGGAREPDSATGGGGRSETSPSGEVQSPGEEPTGAEAFLESITEVHYVDVGLICPGAYLTDPQKLSSVVRRGVRNPLTIGLHGTPRQWAEKRRPWIGQEKDRMLATLRAEAAGVGANRGFQVFERGYCEGGKVGMRMHFEIIDLADFGRPGRT